MILLDKEEIESVGLRLGSAKGSISICLSVPRKKFSEAYALILKNILRRPETRMVYVTIDTPFEQLFKELREYGVPVEKIFFVDSVTKADQDWSEEKQVIYLHSPYDLPNLTTGIAEAIYLSSQEKKFEGAQNFVLLDSISTLLIYNKISAVLKFVEFLTDLVKGRNLKLICLFEQGPVEKKIVSALYNSFDEFIEIT